MLYCPGKLLQSSCGYAETIREEWLSRILRIDRDRPLATILNSLACPQCGERRAHLLHADQPYRHAA